MRLFTQKQQPAQKAKSVSSARPGRTFSGHSREKRSILHLQRTIGNHAEQRLLQPNAEELETGSIPNASPRFVYHFSQIPLNADERSNIQPKRKVSAPRDLYEQEADRVADHVMRMPELSPPLDRRCTECQSQAEQLDQKKEQLQTPYFHQNHAKTTLKPTVVQEGLRSPGHPLDHCTRQKRFNLLKNKV